MRSELHRAGAALTSVAVVTAGAYLVAIVTDGHSNPTWPFSLLGALALGGAAMFLITKPASQPRLTKEYVMDRLVLGFNSYALRTELAASKTHPDDYTYPARQVGEFISTVNETFNVSLGMPAGPIDPGNFVSYLMQRIRQNDATGAAIFRLGGDLGSWWQTKDSHDSEVDSIVQDNLMGSAAELEALKPKSSRNILKIMKKYQHQDTKTPDDQLPLEFMDKIATTIVG